MGQRLDLHTLFESLVPEGAGVYFQPPDNLQIVYPCIIYQRYNAKTQFADGYPYIYTDRYQVTVVDRDPDGLIAPKVAALPMCIKNRFFVVNNLNHDVYNLYF